MSNSIKLLSLISLLFLAGQVPAIYAQEAAAEQADEIPVEDEIPADEEEQEETEAVDTAEKMAGSAVDMSKTAPAYPELLPVFKQFGEEAGLVKLMDVFMEKLLADPRMRPFFENSDQARVKKHLVEQFCVILGGPCTYSGRDMKSSHAALGIDRAHFNALVEDLQWAMNKQGIPFRAQNKLLAKLAPMHRQIETK
ncbi:MAG: group I truncated hemoglobin [Arenimonas sp.]